MWVDILQRRLLRYWPEGDAIEQRTLVPLFSTALLTERREQFLLVSDRSILLYHWEDCQAQPALLCPYPRDAAAIAPDGSLWFSTMDVNESAPLGGWYRFAPGDSRPVKMAGAMTIPNTLAWHEDRVWFADSAEQLFFSASGQRILSQEMSSHAADDMTPDGSALSHEGDLINARFGHGCLSHYRIRHGTLTLAEHVPLPVTQPNCCAFGGSGGTTLYITSARKQLAAPGELGGALLQVANVSFPVRLTRGLGRERRYESVGQDSDDGVTPPSSRRPAALSALQRQYFPRSR